MEDIQINIKEGIKLHIIPNDIYKTNLIRIVFTTPARYETVTDTAMIPLVLQRGSINYPTQEIINTRLEELYGAELVANIDKKGDLQTITFDADFVKDKFIPNNESLSKEVFDLVFDVVLNPLVENDGFKENYVESEKEKLKKIINQLIDDKDAYSYYCCIHEMFGNNGFGLYQMGVESEVDKINSKDLYAFYKQFIDIAKIDIFISGEVDQASITSYIKDKTKDLKERNFDAVALVSTISPKKVDKPDEVFQSLDVIQGKLVIGCQVGYNQGDKNYVGLVYNTLLGASASSLLFQNVREKAGLAYYVISRYIEIKDLLFIRGGIEIKNYKKALELIKRQLEMLENGDFSQENINDAKTTIYSSLRSTPESQDASINYYYMQEFYAQQDTIDSLIKKVEIVTKDEIIEFAKSIKINIIYFLKDNK